jgi:glycosyltransferase involved in cell wall biosynthesis
VIFAGFVPHAEIPRYYGIACLGVFPSVADEAFGISICEAMACGLPTIGTCVGGIPEVIEDKQTGFLVPPRSEEALMDKIEKLIRNPDEGREIGRKASKRVRELFTWEKVTDRLMQVYREVLITGRG